MEKVKIIAKNFINAKVLSKAGMFAILLAIALAAPLLKSQIITGSLVNAVLFSTVILLGLVPAILISFLPSLVASLSGTLPLPLLPMIPYIIMGNIILVLLFGFLRKRSFIFGVIAASLIKFLFLFASSSLIINFFIQKNLPKAITAMMSWPQLSTALIGGLLTFMILRNYGKNKTNINL